MEKQIERERGSGGGGGEEPRANQHSLLHPCAEFVSVMQGSHFDLQLSLSAQVQGNRKSYMSGC